MRHNTNKSIIKALAALIVKGDNLLYKTLGVVTPWRRESWKRRGARLQRELDAQHDKRDRVNMLLGRDYNTKTALRVYYGDKFADYCED